jgi:queuine tRNA-ribosyltransferase
MIKLNMDGYSIGGLAVGESQKEMLEIVKLLDGILPKDKPRYLMGVGTLSDIYLATQLGVDMFDCVLPTRMARHGIAYAKVKSQKSKVESGEFEEINILKAENQNNSDPIDKNCQCPVCHEGFSRAYLHHLVKEKEILGIRLLTLHNLYTYINLIKEIRKLVDK